MKRVDLQATITKDNVSKIVVIDTDGLAKQLDLSFFDKSLSRVRVRNLTTLGGNNEQTHDLQSEFTEFYGGVSDNSTEVDLIINLPSSLTTVKEFKLFFTVSPNTITIVNNNSNNIILSSPTVTKDITGTVFTTIYYIPTSTGGKWFI